MQKNNNKIKYASLADALCPKLGTGYLLKGSKVGGIGLFANINFHDGDIICAYDGIKKHRKDVPFSSTHCLSIKESDYVIDGYPLRNDLVFDKETNSYFPKTDALRLAGWACIANSCRNDYKDCDENAKMVWILDDHSVRCNNYNPFDQTPISTSIKNVLLYKPFLIAKKNIQINEEILWNYNPSL